MEGQRSLIVILLMSGGLLSIALGVTTISLDCQYARIGVDIWLSFVVSCWSMNGS